jgi:hypothetical protein
VAGERRRPTLCEFLEFAGGRLDVLANLCRHPRKLAPLRRLALESLRPPSMAAAAARSIREERRTLRGRRGAESGRLDSGPELGRAVKVGPRHVFQSSERVEREEVRFRGGAGGGKVTPRAPGREIA